MASVVKRSARAILLDDQSRLVLIKRTRPGQDPYWTAPGGGLEPADISVQSGLRRELREELGAKAEGYEQVFLFSSPAGEGVSVQHFFVCRLVSLDMRARTGPEFADASRGGYDLDFVGLGDESLTAVDLKPDALKDFIAANREALLAAVGL
ncbi:MAG: NUDIX domain-containing protein [Egibacteraceae bacterium]